MTMSDVSPENDHFKGKDALRHVVEKKSEGIFALSESHGTEMPGHISSGADAAKEGAMALLILWGIMTHFNFNHPQVLLVLASFSFAWIIWKVGRSARLGWARLERLHRILEEEKYEIENNRAQERDELAVLYRAKGFEGKLLEEVLDVLMADGDRLLRVMLQEEMGLNLGSFEHPLKQALGAGVGAAAGLALCLLVFLLYPTYGMIVGAFTAIGISSAVSAKYEDNELIPAIVWGVGLSALTFGVVYFMLEFIRGL